MAIVGFDGKTYPSVEAMQKAMQQQDTDKLRQIGLDKGADEKFFQSNQFQQFLKQNPMMGVYPTVVVNDAYGFGNSPRTNAMAKYYTDYLTETGQQGRIKKSAEQLGFESLPASKPAKDTLPPNAPDGMYDPKMIARPGVMAFGYNPKTGQFVTAGSGTPDNPGDFVFRGNYESLFEMFPEAKARFEEGKRIGFSNLKPFASTGNTDMAQDDKDLTDQEQVIKQKSEQAQKKELAPEETITYDPQQVKDKELLTTKGKLLSEPEDITATKIDTSKFEQEKPTKEKPAETYEASTVGDVGELDAAVGELSDESKVVAAQGEVSPDALVEAATAELDPRATVKYQLADLYKSIQEGEELPAWASPAVRKVSAIMAQRGLGSSSMASAAITQALMESGVAIAQQDANRYATLQLQNLTNRQQAAIQNATVVASMDMANLNNRQAAAVNNAKAFLSIDLQNLTNEQQSNTINFQSQVQALLSDASQENAAKQFNAKSENELEQFFAELGAQIETSTLNRLSALEEYNVSQEDAVQIFNNQQKSQREQFNTNMRVAIDQSNTQWRRQINTANTAAQNEVNRQNVLTLTGMRQQALNDLWQLYKDQASWSMKISENREDRAHNAAMQASAIADNASNYNDNFNKYLVLKTIDNIFRPQKD